MGYRYAFEAELQRRAYGQGRPLHHVVVRLPPDLLAQAPFASGKPVRVVGELAEHPIRGAFQPDGEGGRFLMVSPALRKAARLSVGDVVECRFDLDDPDAVEVPDALLAGLRRDRAARTAWDGATPGRRRGLAWFVASAKTPATVAARVAKVLDDLAGRAPLRRG